MASTCSRCWWRTSAGTTCQGVRFSEGSGIVQSQESTESVSKKLESLYCRNNQRQQSVLCHPNIVLRAAWVHRAWFFFAWPFHRVRVDRWMMDCNGPGAPNKGCMWKLQNRSEFTKLLRMLATSFNQLWMNVLLGKPCSFNQGLHLLHFPSYRAFMTSRCVSSLEFEHLAEKCQERFCMRHLGFHSISLPGSCRRNLQPFSLFLHETDG